MRFQESEAHRAQLFFTELQVDFHDFARMSTWIDEETLTVECNCCDQREWQRLQRRQARS